MQLSEDIPGAEKQGGEANGRPNRNSSTSCELECHDFPVFESLVGVEYSLWPRQICDRHTERNC